MSWVAVARRDLRAVLQPRSVRYGLYTLGAVFALGGYLFPVMAGPPPVAMADFPGFMSAAVTLFVPLVAVILGHKAVVGERASGELALTLSLPHTRREVVLGKLCSRGGLLAATVVAGLLIAAALVVYPYGRLEPLIYLGYLAVTLLFGLAFLNLAVGVSAITTSERVATVVALGLYALFVVLWDLVREAVAIALETIGLTAGPLPDPALFLLGAEPVSAYERAIDAFWGGAAAPAPGYLGGWVALLLLVGWAVLPLLAGDARFRRVDL